MLSLSLYCRCHAEDIYMIIGNRLSDTIYTAGRNAYFDRCAKMLIANPQILSRILSECVSEYKDLTPDEIESRYLTEGSVRVSSEPLYRDVMRPGADISITEEIDEGADAMCDISVGFL